MFGESYGEVGGKVIGGLELVEPEKALKYVHSGNSVMAPCAELLGAQCQELKHFTARLDREFGTAEFDPSDVTVEISEEAVRRAKMMAPTDLKQQRLIAFQLYPQLIAQDKARKAAEAKQAAQSFTQEQSMPMPRPKPTRPMPKVPLRQPTKRAPSAKQETRPAVPELTGRPVFKKTKKKRRVEEAEEREEQTELNLADLLLIDDLGVDPAPPNVVVTFRYPGLPDQVGYYHWVRPSEKILGLIYDSRHEYSNFFAPASGRQTDLVDIVVSHRTASERYDFRCFGPVMTTSFGVFQMLYMVRVPEQLQEQGYPIQPEHLSQFLDPQQDQDDEEMDYDKKRPN
jgi:hypothetical protein